jgi:hypothetical protein
VREDDDGKSHGIAYKSGVNDSIGENRKGRRIDVQQAAFFFDAMGGCESNL